MTKKGIADIAEAFRRTRGIEPEWQEHVNGTADLLDLVEPGFDRALFLMACNGKALYDVYKEA